MSDHTPAPASHEICVEAAVLRTVGLTMEQQMLMADRLDKVAHRVQRLERAARRGMSGDLATLLYNIVDNLNDLPVNKPWADDVVQQILEMLE